MTAELVAIIITGVISGFDLVINAVSLCTNGRSKIRCCGCSYYHESEDVVKVDTMRRMSGAPKPDKNDDTDSSVN